MNTTDDNIARAKACGASINVMGAVVMYPSELNTYTAQSIADAQQSDAVDALENHEPLQDVNEAITAKIDEIREILDETYNFAATSPRSQQNINAVSDLLDEIAAIAAQGEVK